MQRYIQMAPAVESDWVPLARQLGIGDRDVLRIQLDHVNVVEQAAAALRLWARAAVTRSNGCELEAALRLIGRLDIVERFFGDTHMKQFEADEAHGQKPRKCCYVAISHCDSRFVLRQFSSGQHQTQNLNMLLSFCAISFLITNSHHCQRFADKAS